MARENSGKIAESEIDEFGTPYSKYPECPYCPGGGRVSLCDLWVDLMEKYQDATGINRWFCYECGLTF
jgi:hypothetical protein